MAKFRLIADEARQVSILPAGELRTVQPDEVFDVPDQVAESYECQPHFYEQVSAPKASAKGKGDQ
jgi:hypothetical protein